MNPEANLQSLEWPTLLRHYSVHCQSVPAREAALTVTLAESVGEAENLLDLTSEAIEALDLGSFGSLSSLENLNGHLQRLARSSTLDGKELLQLAKLAEISSQVRTLFSSKDAAASCPRLSSTGKAIPDLTSVVAPIRYAIDEEGQVRDSASPTLRSLRDQERKLHAEARDRIDAILQSAFRDGYLQDKFFDFRDGRYLIPVKSEAKNRISGFVVESSATKATVFMEPAAVRDTNDKIKQTQLLIEEEVFRILDELSRKLHPRAGDFASAYQLSVEIDLCLARGRFAQQYASFRGVSRPAFSDQFDLEELYHPLLGFVLKPEQIVRNSFHLGPRKKVLVISGPNTGGKTVLLKAVGLCTLMARAGFYIPCDGMAKLPFFKKVLVQIGDSQNLELSLSSFSGSVLHLKEILEESETQCLVLVDEILHATDPDEATALSRAIMKELQSRGAFAIVTTHLNGLKVTGESEFESASMEFDPEKLSPTYRLRMGIPGSSRALEIALKLGLNEGVVTTARSFLSEEKVREQSAVDKLEIRERELEESKIELQQVKGTLEEERSRLNQLNSELESLKKRFRSEALAKLRDQQRSAMQEVENLISTYKKKLQSVEEKHSAALEAQGETESVRKRFEEIQSVLDEIAPPEIERAVVETLEKSDRPTFRMNAPVRVLSMNSEGILLSDPSQRQKPAEIMIGQMRLKLPWDQLEPKGQPQAKVGKGSRHAVSETFDVPSEVNLIGKTVDEAMDVLENFVDRAVRSGRPFVRIVHGHGSGALRRAVREFLKKTDYELKYRPGTSQEGGEGCTVVEFI